MADDEPAGRRYRQAGHRAHRPHVHRAAGSRRAGRRADRGVRPGGHRVARLRGPGAAGLPWLLFLQGGPGVGALRPMGRDAWLDRALDDYRVLLLDQRGTGRSTPASRHTLAPLGSRQAQADYLAHFRADSIVRDAELIRRQLTGGQPWSVLGQSFGGFCTVSYLSLAPEGIREAFITGGLPGLRTTADDVYRVTYPMVARKNRRTTSVTRRTRGGRADRPATWPATGAAGRRPADRARPSSRSAGCLALARAVTPCTTCWRTRSLAPSCPMTSCSRRSPCSRSRPGRCTRWCTRRATRRAARPAGPRTGSGPNSPRSTPLARWTVTIRCCSPAR